MAEANIVTIHGAQRKLDWVRDPRPSDQDWKFEDRVKQKYGAVGVPLPDTVNLTSKESPIRDQGQEGSCTGFAWSGVCEYELRNRPAAPFRDALSPQFMYWNERSKEGTISDDAGAYIKDGASVLGSIGIATERLWPYHDNPEAMRAKPSDAAFADALTRKVSSRWRIFTLESMLQNLALGHPFVFGMTLYESFQSDTVAKTGLVPMPKPNETALGGHAVSAYGYSKPHKLIICRNQWGWNWGAKGHFYVPFDYMANSDLTDDRWTIRV